MKEIPTLEEAKDLFARTSYCEHHHCENVTPYGCDDVKVLTCMVCAKEIERVYC